jgi:hypothetical protein
MKTLHIVIAAAALPLAGCAHEVTFEDAQYSISGARSAASVIAVIDADTRRNKVPIRSFMAGIVHIWEAEPGDMLRQVAEIELPQAFARFELADSYREPTDAGRWIVLELTVPEYQFANFHATLAVAAIAYDRGRKELLRKTYRAEGESQGAKMFWGAAVGMKPAIRQSSLDAYKKVFAELRADLAAKLKE